MKFYTIFIMLLLPIIAPPLNAMEVADSPLLEASRKGNVAAVQRLLTQDPTLVNERDNDGNTPLHWASRQGRTFKAALLPDRHCAKRAKISYPDYHSDNRPDFDPNSRELSKQPYRYREIARILISNGAAIDRQNKGGQTPLHAAAWLGDTDIASLLLEHSASIDKQDAGGWTPLHIAAHGGLTAMVHFLLAHGASYTQDNHGKTPMDLAKSRGYDGVAELIQQCLQIRQQRCAAAKVAFGCVLHPRLREESPASIFPLNVIQEIVHKLHPEDFSVISK